MNPIPQSMLMFPLLISHNIKKKRKERECDLFFFLGVLMQSISQWNVSFDVEAAGRQRNQTL